jgi:hypothetical protein
MNLIIQEIKIKLIFLATLWRFNVLRQIEPMNPNDHPLRTTILNFSFIHKRVTLALVSIVILLGFNDITSSVLWLLESGIDTIWL